MPAKSDLTTAQLTDFLSANYGCEINSDAVRHACVEFGVTYPTAVKRLRDFYVKRGTWNLTVQERLEQTYEAPAAAPVRVVPSCGTCWPNVSTKNDAASPTVSISSRLVRP